jgi:small ligand-binding sensory domain FIST
MIRAGAGQSSSPSTEQGAEHAAAEAMAQAGVSRADTVVVFFTVDHAAHGQTLFSTLSRVTGTDRIVGSSGAGILTGAGEIEGSQGVAVLVFSSDEIQSRPFLFKPLRDHDAELGAAIARMADPRPDQTSLLAMFPDTYNGQPNQLLRGIEQQIGFVPVVGAGSSESGTAQATYQICGEDCDSNSVAGLHLSGFFETAVEITQGCQPITSPMVITKAERNLIFELDGRPAVEAFLSVLKGPLAEDLRRALMFVFVGLPPTADRNSVAPGEYLVRNIIGLDPAKGILAVADEVREGQSLVFTLRDGQRARDDLGQMLQRQSRKLEGRRPAFGFYFNCCARGSSLYGIPGIDTAYIRQTLGDFPLIGMFGGYELAPLGKKNHLFAYTGVLALITSRLPH